MLFNKTLLAVAALAFFGVASAATNPATTTFKVLIKINASCTIATGSPASDIQIGAVGGVDADSGINTGTNNLSVTCSKNTPYNIGLTPTNVTSTTGAGQMVGTGTNTDKVPYQLYKTAASAGNEWGNTATGGAIGTVGNGYHGIGSGGAQTIPVFATAPSANFTPDSYTDTVTVNVSY